MKQSIKRVQETLVLASVALMHLGGSGWAGPPPVPAVPVGGVGSTVATSILIVGYGIWKSRR
jgi:hypothetical protein